MYLANQILDIFATVSLPVAMFWLLMQNILQLVLCVGCGEILVRIYANNRIAPLPAPLQAKEVWLAALCVILNTVVAVIGFLLWKQGIIVIYRTVSWSVFVDFAVLMILMDFLMYVTHRFCHLPFVFPFVHATHHLYDNPRPLSLFVLNPMEVFGFGALWLIVLTVYHSSWLGIVLYLLMNAIWGTLGHLGVEPMPRGWVNLPVIGHISTSTFHAQHHVNKNVNFGFYTDIWDELLRTLEQHYRRK